MKKETKKYVVSKKQDALNLLVELYNTGTWEAIKMLTRLSDSDSIATLASVDPFKDPTLVARTQGHRSGIYHLENLLNAELQRLKNLEETSDNDGKVVETPDHLIPGY